MSEILAHFTAAGVPLVAPATLPTIRIRRTDTQVLVVTDSAMTEQGDGSFSFTFAPAAALEYSIRADGDPIVAGQVSAQERFQYGSLSGITENEIETTIPALLTGQGTIITGIIANLTAIGALNDLSSADIQAAMTAQGYTSARALLLDNLDAAISSIATLLVPLAGMDTRLILIEKLLRNRFETDPVTGIATLYDDDSVTPLISTTIFQDVAATIPYQGIGLERRNRLV